MNEAEVAIVMVVNNVSRWNKGVCMVREPWLDFVEERLGREDNRYRRSESCEGELFGIERVPGGEFVTDVCRSHISMMGLLFSPFRSDVGPWIREQWEIDNDVQVMRQLRDATRAVFGGQSVAERFRRVVKEAEEFGVWLRQWAGKDAELVAGMMYAIEDEVGIKLDQLFEYGDEETWRR